MKNLKNCHSIGLHSFPISFENGLYKRIFYADTNHNLYKPFELAIHPHHVDITIRVLEGELFNPLYQISSKGDLFNTFRWNSHILNGKGGFTLIGQERLKQISNHSYTKNQSVTMKSCELHTVQVNKNQKCVWLIEEQIPSCEYFPINYSPNDLTKWNSDGLYIEVNDVYRNELIKHYI